MWSTLAGLAAAALAGFASRAISDLRSRPVATVDVAEEWQKAEQARRARRVEERPAAIREFERRTLADGVWPLSRNEGRTWWPSGSVL